MHLINSGVQHIGLDGAPDVVKGDPVRFIVALGDSGPQASRDEKFFEAAVVPYGLPLVSEHWKIITQRRRKPRQDLFNTKLRSNE